ncbi:hypothetical protein QJS04_geneDACA015157 [Acorus gramineus]|uniref:Uncharacterized protein n=1 Tax=Acorus gramineus TaxID=55184 RepID=A0AAV9BYN5_ACOGR|nr:hypothetical protein QJS04_geneDACA015157 [Acorus gramineus]
MQHLLSFPGAKEIVNYHVISPEGLAKSVMLEGGWSNILCSGRNLQKPVDYAVVFVGEKLQSSDISKNEHIDPALVDLLKLSFTKSNSSIAYPYVTVSDEKETMENYLISAFTENCGVLGVNDIAFLESCSIVGEDLTKLAGLHSIHDYIGSRVEMEQKGTQLIVVCNKGSEELGHAQSEGEILSELVSLLEHSGASYSILYASNPFKSLHHPSVHVMDRFLAEDVSGKDSANVTLCDGVCQIKSSLLEGIFVVSCTYLSTPHLSMLYVIASSSELVMRVKGRLINS